METGEGRNVPLVGRRVELREFKDLLRMPVAASLSCVYGPAGIGKTALMRQFREESTSLGLPCLFLYGKDCKDLAAAEGDMHFLDASRLWQTLEVNPASRTSLLHFRSRRALLPDDELLDDARKSITSQFPQEELHWSVKLAGAVAWYLYRLVRGRLREHPERALLDGLARDLKRGPVLWLVDDHDLAGVLRVQTRLHLDVAPRWGTPESVPFIDYLERVLLYLSGSNRALVTVVAGRSPLPKLVHQPNRVRDRLLSGMNASQVQEWLGQRLGPTLDDAHRLDYLAHSLVTMTQGTPALLEYAIALLEDLVRSGEDPDEQWQKLLGQYRQQDAEHRLGLHAYVTERLIERLPDPQRLIGRLGRLALPYRLLDDPELESILFPGEGPRPFEQLAAAGIFGRRAGTRSYELHAVTRQVLEELGAGDQAEITALHRRLTRFFKAPHEPEAHAYHRLCGEYRGQMMEAGMEPETYWRLLATNISLTDATRQRWRLEKLPAKPAVLKRRITILVDADHRLGQGELCGDALAFLRHKVQESGLDLRRLDLEDLDALVEEAPHLSDLHYLRARETQDSEEALEQYRAITNRINPAHGAAWYRQACLCLELAKRREARRAFAQARTFGVPQPLLDHVEGQLAWMAGDPRGAERWLTRAWKGGGAKRCPSRLRNDLAALRVHIGQYTAARQLLEEVEDIDGRGTFLRLEACYRQGDLEAVLQLGSALPEMPAWEKDRCEVRVAAARRSLATEKAATMAPEGATGLQSGTEDASETTHGGARRVSLE